MNEALALERVQDFIDVLGESKREWLSIPDTLYGRDTGDAFGYQVVERQILERISLVESIAKQFDERLAAQIRTRDLNGWDHTSKLRASYELSACLRQVEEAAAILEPAGPKLSASHFHPWVWLPAQKQWDAGHRRDAVQRASTSVFDVELRGKVGLYNMQPLDLIGHVFNVEDPKPGDVRLRLQGYVKATPEWRDIHKGMRDFGLGCVAAIRNLTTHGLDEPNEPVALEALAALSYLARRIDDAVVHTG
jgi:hypothetical protein